MCVVCCVVLCCVVSHRQDASVLHTVLACLVLFLLLLLLLFDLPSSVMSTPKLEQHVGISFNKRLLHIRNHPPLT